MARITNTTWGHGTDMLRKYGPNLRKAALRGSKAQLEEAVRLSRARARRVPLYPTLGAKYIADTIQVVAFGPDVQGIRIGSPSRRTTGGGSSGDLWPAWMFGSNRSGPRKGRGKHLRQLPPKPSGKKSHFGWDEFNDVAEDPDWQEALMEKAEVMTFG